MQLAYATEARLELLDILQWHEEQQEGLAADPFDEITKAEELILEQPEAWGLVGRGYRRKLIDRYPYGLVYKLDKDKTIQVIAVAHTSRSPGYWKDRL